MPFVPIDLVQPGVKLAYATDGGVMYNPRSGWHIKFHEMVRDKGVVDRFHVTDEGTEHKVYYRINNTGVREYLVPGLNGPDQLRAHSMQRVGSSIDNFDALADGFLALVKPLVSNDAAAVQTAFEKRKSDALQGAKARSSTFEQKTDLDRRLSALQGKGLGMDLARLKTSELTDVTLNKRREEIEALEARSAPSEAAATAELGARNVLPNAVALPRPVTAPPPVGRIWAQVGLAGPLVVRAFEDAADSAEVSPATSPVVATRKRQPDDGAPEGEVRRPPPGRADL